MENFMKTGEGFTIVISGQTSRLGPDVPVHVHGLFDTREDAQEYANGDTSLRQPDGTYQRINAMPYTILPLTMQG